MGSKGVGVLERRRPETDLTVKGEESDSSGTSGI